MKLSAKKIYEEKVASQKDEIEKFINTYHCDPPRLTILTTEQYGVASPTNTYIQKKNDDCWNVGIRTAIIRKPDEAYDAYTQLRQAIAQENFSTTDGIMLQLPTILDAAAERRLMNIIDPTKDVDGLTDHNLNRLIRASWDRRELDECFIPATAAGVVMLLDYYGINVTGKHVAIFGRSRIVGMPLFLLLTARGATCTLCHSKTSRMMGQEMGRSADIVVFATGRPSSYSEEYLRLFTDKNPVVIDCGTTFVDGKLRGDFDIGMLDHNNLLNKVDYTPVPGGIGLMTRIALTDNVIKAWKRRIIGLRGGQSV